jgi:nucleoside-diphosphate-sugar epimerase
MVTGNVRDAEAVRAAVEGAGTVYHLAGVVAAFRSSDMMQTNATALRNVVEACSRCASPPTLVIASSLAAAGPSSVDRPRVETDPSAPVSHYGRSKRAGELIAEEYAARVPITVVRPPVVFGEGDRNLQPVFRTVYRLGLHVAAGLAHYRYSMIHVSDLVEAMMLAAQSGARLAPNVEGGSSATGYYFVGDDEQPTYAELGKMIGAALGRNRVFVFRTPSTVSLWPVAAVSEALSRIRRRPSIFNFDKAREARAGSWTCSTAAIRADLGFVPAASLAERLRQTADWYLERKLL